MGIEVLAAAQWKVSALPRPSEGRASYGFVLNAKNAASSASVEALRSNLAFVRWREKVLAVRTERDRAAGEHRHLDLRENFPRRCAAPTRETVPPPYFPAAKSFPSGLNAGSDTSPLNVVDPNFGSLVNSTLEPKDLHSVQTVGMSAAALRERPVSQRIDMSVLTLPYYPRNALAIGLLISAEFLHAVEVSGSEWRLIQLQPERVRMGI